MIDASEYLLSIDSRPQWLSYPTELVTMVQSGRVSFPPWYLLTAKESLQLHIRLRQSLRRELIPFAYRQDREELACLEAAKGHMVVLIYDYAKPGWENGGRFGNYSDWLFNAEEEARQWDEEEKRVGNGDVAEWP